MTTQSTAGSSIDSIEASPKRANREATSEENEETTSSLTLQLEALAELWEALQSLPDQETSPSEYLETADTRSRLESQLQDRLKRLGADVLEEFLAARDDRPSDHAGELPAALTAALEESSQSAPDLEALLPELYADVTDAPTHIAETTGLESELDAIEDLLSSDRLQAFASLPDELHRAMLTVVVSRMRRAQTYKDHRLAGPLDLQETISELFRTLGRHLNRFDPGYIRGMKLEHDPYTDSWVSDITHWSSRLGELCNDYLSTPLGHQAFDEPSEPPEHLEAHRALNSIEESLADDSSDRDDLRDLVATYLDRGLNAAHPRLVDMLAPHSELFTGDRFQPLQHAFSAVE